MRGRTICDASALVALLLDSGPEGQWATSELSGTELAAPDLVGFETANIIRQALSSQISEDQAAQAHQDLLDLTVELWSYDILAGRAWELRQNLSLSDGSYVALAELVQAPLITLDRRIGGAPGVRCDVRLPPAGSRSA